MKNNEKLRISVVIPVYNESKSLQRVLTSIKKTLINSNVHRFEIITVNDGSTDESLNILQKFNKKNIINMVINNKHNMGYGYSLKTGIKHSKYEWILIIDSDGAFPGTEITKLINNICDNDMIVGSRAHKYAHIPFERILPKKIINYLTFFLTGEHVPDLNSGLRMFKKSLSVKFWHLYPNGFSFTTTITLASLMNDYQIKFVPIKCNRPSSASSIKSVDFFYFMLLIIRLVVYYQPLRFFFWPGVLFILCGLSLILFTLFSEENVTDTGLLIFMTGIQSMFFGLIADLIVKIREKES